jgi:hypothetical protein
MKRVFIKFLIFIFLILFYSSNCFAGESNSYILEPCSLNGGGYQEESANFCFSDVAIGEPIGGYTQSAIYDLEIGYINIITATGNLPPALEAIGDKTISEGQALTFTIKAVDPEKGALIYSASNLPQGAVFNSATCVFTWTPNYTQSGTYLNIRFEVKDSEGLSDSENIAIVVNNVNRPPVLEAIGNKAVIEGRLLQFTIIASDLDNDALIYSASNLPSGASFNSAARTFTWTPATGQSGIYANIRFNASDGTATDLEDITITVSKITPPEKPTVDPVVSPTKNNTQTITGAKTVGAVKITISSQEAVVGPVSYPTPFSWSFTATLKEGNNDFTVVAEDAAGTKSASEDFTIVLDTTAPEITITFPSDGSYVNKYGNAQ